jgi:hypothetical protein
MDQDSFGDDEPARFDLSSIKNEIRELEQLYRDLMVEQKLTLKNDSGLISLLFTQSLLITRYLVLIQFVCCS